MIPTIQAPNSTRRMASPPPPHHHLFMTRAGIGHVHDVRLEKKSVDKNATEPGGSSTSRKNRQ